MGGDYCAFCDTSERKSRLVTETENFYVMPSIGQISDGGYVMVIPKMHEKCFGELTRPMFNEFVRLKTRVEDAVRDAYGQTIGFEHGIIGQTVYHAHWHIIPFNGDSPFRRLLEENNSARFMDSIRVESDNVALEQIKEGYMKWGQYMIWQDADKSTLLIEPGDVPKMYLRLVAADSVGRPERGNWREWRSANEALDDSLMAETVVTLRDMLGKP